MFWIILTCLIISTWVIKHSKPSNQPTLQPLQQGVLESRFMHISCLWHDREPEEPLDLLEFCRAKSELLTALLQHRGLPTFSELSQQEEDACLVSLLKEVRAEGGMMGKWAHDLLKDIPFSTIQ